MWRADTERTTKMLIKFVRMQCKQKNQFFLCGGTNKAFMNPICGYANREGLVESTQLLKSLRSLHTKRRDLGQHTG